MSVIRFVNRYYESPLASKRKSFCSQRQLAAKYNKGREREFQHTHQQPEQPTDTLRPATLVYY